MSRAYLSPRRLIPRVSFTNYHKQYPTSVGCWYRWFYIRRFWGDGIIYIGVKHWCLSLDFRGDWLRDMTNK